MIGTLQALRFIFMMMIFMSHFTYNDICAFDAGGDCGVAFFFMLSGFVCSLSYGQSIRNGSFCYGRFMWKRLKKFYPIHLLCLMLFLLVNHAVLDTKVLLNMLLLQSWVPDPNWYFSCNSVSWFLSSLLFCYMVFPLVYRLLSKRLTLLILIVYTIVCWLTPYDCVNAILYVFPLVRLVDFYLGMLLCQVYEQKSGMYINTGIELLLVVLLSLSLVVYPFVDAKLRNAPMYWVVLMPLIIVFAHEKGAVSRLLSSRPMLFLGSLTLPLFLTHRMLIDIITHHLPEIPSVLMLGACLIITFVISWGAQMCFSKLIRL
jgi:peptidoglycan/LPS O-acetylase OafA/YrhL